MSILQGENIQLRALEPEDINFLFSVENSDTFWEISYTQLPYSKHILKKYIENAHQDIYEAKQYRFAICNAQNQPIGIIDLFDFVPQHQRVGIGILILPEYQNKGFASEALKIIKKYTFTYLNIHQLFAEISCENSNSIQLFEKLGFQKTGVKKDWIFSNQTFKDVFIYQLLF